MKQLEEMNAPQVRYALRIAWVCLIVEGGAAGFSIHRALTDNNLVWLIAAAVLVALARRVVLSIGVVWKLRHQHDEVIEGWTKAQQHIAQNVAALEATEAEAARRAPMQ